MAVNPRPLKSDKSVEKMGSLAGISLIFVSVEGRKEGGQSLTGFCLEGKMGELAAATTTRANPGKTDTPRG